MCDIEWQGVLVQTNDHPLDLVCLFMFTEIICMVIEEIVFNLTIVFLKFLGGI